MSTAAPTLQQLRREIGALLTHPDLTITELACVLHMSRSTLQRIFSIHDTSFVRELRFVRVERAVVELVKNRRGAQVTAALLGISPDHLCRILKDVHGLTARDLIRVRVLDGRLRAWRAEVPPRAGTALYRRRLEEWGRADQELQAILGDLPHGHPLAAWAKEILVMAARPDYRTKDQRRRIQDTRRRDAEQATAALATLVPDLQPASGDPSRRRGSRTGRQRVQPRPARDIEVIPPQRPGQARRSEQYP